MTREEEIDHAKMTYLEGLNYDPSVCFEEGVEWTYLDELLPKNK